MTRQKKEILKKISIIQDWIEVDRQLGCGCEPYGFYDDLYLEIYSLETKLADLQHYGTVNEMFMDTRYQAM